MQLKLNSLQREADEAKEKLLEAQRQSQRDRIKLDQAVCFLNG